MKIWIFQTGEPLHSDENSVRSMRAMNLADMLIKSGHQVIIWSSAFYHQEKRHRSQKFRKITVNDSLQIRLIPSRGYGENISFERLVDHAQLAINLSRELSSETTLPDVAFVGYPPIEFAYIAVKWLRANNIPSMIDVKDQWPHIFVEAFPQKVQCLAKILFFPYFYIGKKTLQNATAFCAMTESYMNWMYEFSKRSRTHSDCIISLSPLPLKLSRNTLDEAKIWWKKKGIIDDGCERFFFVGNFSSIFNFQPIFDAAHKALKMNKNWQFIICGTGDRLVEFRRLFLNTSNVIFPGWINRPQLIALADMSSAGLAPYKNINNFTCNIPNKIIDYLSLGKPIISPLDGEVEILINKYDVGVKYSQHKGETLFEVLEKFSRYPYKIQILSNNAISTYRKYFSGEKVYKKLVNNLTYLTDEKYISENDKQIECSRYDAQAKQKLENNNFIEDEILGPMAIAISLRSPYLYYEKELQYHLNSSCKVLEIGSGTGMYTGILLATGAQVIASDISKNALNVLHKQYQHKENLLIQLADIESLPFSNNTFDVIASAGSLSYGDTSKVLYEIYRLLKPDGVFICVDSLNHNMIYRFNRWLHYMKGNRSRSTLVRMPKLEMIEAYRCQFGDVSVEFFGSVSWLMPLFVKLFGEKQSAIFSKNVDKWINVKKSAFKFVMIAKKINI